MGILNAILKKVEKIDFLFPNTFEELMNNEYYDYDKFEWFLYYVFKFEAEASVEKIGKKGKGDGGADLIVTIPHENGGIRRIGIQAKYWKNRVGTQPVNQLASAKVNHNLTDLWIITTSDLTPDAMATAERLGIQVLRGEDVSGFIESIKERYKKDINDKGDSAIKFLENSEPLISYDTPKEIINEDFEKIKSIRIDIAKKHNLFPVYNVFTNKVAEELILKKPMTVDELKTIKGIGEKKIQLFGEELVSMINDSFSVQGNNQKDEILYQVLLKERIKIAKFNKLEENDVYSDKVIQYLVKMKPSNKEELSKIYGFRKENIDIFGEYLIKVIIRNTK